MWGMINFAVQIYHVQIIPAINCFSNCQASLNGYFMLGGSPTILDCVQDCTGGEDLNSRNSWDGPA